MDPENQRQRQRDLNTDGHTAGSDGIFGLVYEPARHSRDTTP